jgi:hypothetical protein
MQRCEVSYIDGDGIRHSVETFGESLYHAAAAGLALLGNHGFLPPHTAEIQVEFHYTTTHKLKINRIEKWLGEVINSPRDMVEKEKVRKLFPYALSSRAKSPFSS